MSLYSQTIHQTRYARWNEEDGRREFWPETVSRYTDFFEEHLAETCDYKLPKKVAKEVYDAIHGLDVMPSMRTLMTAGKALKSAEVANYNCAYLVVDTVKAFSEHMFVLMCGSGSGFSVERRFTDKLPEVPSELHPTDTTIVVADSRKGWCVALNQFLNLLYAGNIPQYDISKVREEGARLKTFGGYSSGPKVLVELFEHIISVFRTAQGRKLRPIEVFSIMCYIAQIVVVGGVRRCIDSSTLLPLERGLVRANEVVVGDKVLSVDGEYRTILDVAHTGEKETLRIRTRGGEIRVTPEHRVAKFDAVNGSFDDSEVVWVEAGKLAVGDLLVFDTQGSSAGIEDIPDIQSNIPSRDTNSQHIDAQALTSKEWAYLLGYFQGDGYTYATADGRKKAISFALSGDYPAIKTKIEGYLERLGAAYAEISHANYSVVRVTNTQIAKLFAEFKTPKTDMSVPTFVLEGTRDVRVAYIAGLLDADGSCKGGSRRSGRKTLQIVTSVYPKFFEQVRDVCASLGYPTTTWEHPAQPTKNGGVAQRKWNLKANTSQLKDAFALELAEYSAKARDEYNYAAAKQDKYGLSRAIPGTNTTVSYAASNYKDRLYPAQVVSVDPYGIVPTLDIMVEGTQSFFAGGHLVHNSATIALFDKDDAEMRSAKSGQWWVNSAHYAMANISAVFESKPRSLEFMDIWRDLVASGSGEPGILNRQALWQDAERIGRACTDKNGARIPFGVNPCCVAGDTYVHTANGPATIASLCERPTVVMVNGTPALSKHGSWVSGTKMLHDITTDAGYTLRCTDDHRVMTTAGWKLPRELTTDDKLVMNEHDYLWEGAGTFAEGHIIGMFVGDGNWAGTTSHYAEVKVWDKDDGADSLRKVIIDEWREIGYNQRADAREWRDYGRGWTTLNTSKFPEKFGITRDDKLDIGALELTSSSFHRGFIRGLFDAGGHVEGDADKGYSVRVASTRHSLLQSVQRMLLRLGIFSTIRRLHDTRVQSLPDGHGGYADYECKAVYRLIVSSRSIQRFYDVIGFAHDKKQARLQDAVNSTTFYNKPFVTSFVALTPVGLDVVYDIEVEGQHAFDANGFIAHNSEISLRPYEFCNLTGAAIRPGDSLEDIKRKVRLATIIGTWQATISDFDFLRKVWKDNVEEERLLGVCLAGIMDHPVLSTQSEESQAWLEELREHAWEVNKEWAEKLGINSTASVTAIKPAGNCRPWYSLVTTDKGIYTMEDYALTGAVGTQTPRGSVVGFNDNGDEPLLRVKTTYGMELDCTPNHRWLTQRGMVEAQNLSTDDEIITEVGAYVNTVAAKLRNLPVEALRTRYKQIQPVSLPAEMSSDLAWLVGYLWGDGALSINGYRFRFMDQNRDHLEKANRIFADTFGICGAIIECPDRDAAYLEVGNKHLWHWFIANGMIKYAYEDRESLEMMPLSVRTSAREHIIAFIAGMFDADGHAVTSSSGQMRAVFSNSKDQFSASFQHIALAVGLIFGRSLNTHGDNLQGKKHMWLSALSPKSDEESLDELRKHSIKLAKSGFRRRRDQKAPTFRVQSVEPIGYAPVFDVTTDTGEYLSGAFVSHNSGELYDVSSGIHPRYAPYYIRTVRQSNGDPMTQFLKDNDIPWEVSKQNPRDVVFSFPVKSPEGAICASDLSAHQQLEHWLHFKRYYATHTISCTIYVRDHEWPSVGAWVYEHFDEITGLSFLPYDDHTYEQAPYQPITKERYEELVADFPKEIDWALLAHYEGGKDTTTVSQEYACVSGACALT